MHCSSTKELLNTTWLSYPGGVLYIFRWTETHAAHHDVEVAVDHDGTPPPQVDVLLPPITDLQALHPLAPTVPLTPLWHINIVAALGLWILGKCSRHIGKVKTGLQTNQSKQGSFFLDKNHCNVYISLSISMSRSHEPQYKKKKGYKVLGLSNMGAMRHCRATQVSLITLIMALPLLCRLIFTSSAYPGTERSRPKISVGHKQTLYNYKEYNYYILYIQRK